MKKFLLTALCAVGIISASANSRTAILIGYDSENNSDMNFQEAAACEIFRSLNPDGSVIAAGETDRISADNFDCIWIHIDRIGIGHGNLPDAFKNEATVSALRQFVEDGGCLFLSKQATQLLMPLGRLDARFAPGIYGDGDGAPGTDNWTVQAQIGYWFVNEKDNPNGLDPSQYYDRRGHDIYKGLEVNSDFASETFGLLGSGNGSELWREDHNCMWDLNAYGNIYTAEGKNVVEKFEAENNAIVLGQWGHVQDHAVAGIIEFLPDVKSRSAVTPGRIIANGLAAYELAPRSGVNHYAANIRTLTDNTISYLTAKATTGVSEILTTDNNAVAEYYNLQGIRVSADSLTPGLYIVRQGNKTSKTIVR